MDPPPELHVLVLPRERYAFRWRCRGEEKRVSWRALRLAVLIIAGLLILGVALQRAARGGGSVWAKAETVVLVVLALLNPTPW